MTSTRARWWLAGVVFAALVLFGIRYEHHVHRHLLRPGDALIPLAVASLNGQSVTISASGRPQIINVFATWCVPCRTEMPAFAAMASHVQRQGIEVIGIDQQEDAAPVSQFIKEFALPFPVYIDRSGLAHDVLGAHMIPATIYIDAHGIVRWQHFGPLTRQDWKDLSLLTRSAG